MKVLGTAVAAALLGLSTGTFAQGSGPSSQDTPREAAAAQPGPGSNEGATNSGAMSGSGAVVTTPGTTVTPSTTTTVYSRCDSMMGAEKTRCLRDERASSGSSTAPAGVPVTKSPGDSGPGAMDKTNPGTNRGTGPSPKDAGTSSAGSN